MNWTSSTIVDPSVPAPAIVPLPVSGAPPPPRLKTMARDLRAHARASGALYSRGYDGAADTRTNRDWITQHFSGDAAISAAWDNLVQRARDLARNEPWAGQAIRRIVENSIGVEGIGTEAAVEIGDELDEQTNAEIDTWFKRWAENECDAEGEMDFAEMQALAMSEAAEAGHTFLVRVSDPNPRRIIPLCYQVLEVEQLNNTLDTVFADGRRIKHGIETDRAGRKLAYHFYVDHPYDLAVTSYDTVRVPADRVLHFYRKLRPSQTLGVTWFAAVLQCLRDLSGYVGDEMTAARIGSWFTVAVKRAAGYGNGLGMGDGSSDSDSDGNPLEHLGPGIIADLSANDSIEQINPSRPNSQATPWLKMLLHSMANGIGLTYLGLTGDTAEASFSSSRFAHNKDKVFYRTLQGRFGRRVVLPVRFAAVRELVALGRVQSVTISQLNRDPYRWLSTLLLPPGWDEIQVGEEVSAAVARIQGGLSTLQEECAGRGKNYRRVLKQRAREMAMVRSLDLDLTTNYPGQVSASVAETPAPDGANDQGAEGAGPPTNQRGRG